MTVYLPQNTCSMMFTVILFIIVKNWKQTRFLSTGKQLNKMWYIYAMEYYYSALKRDKIMWRKLKSLHLMNEAWHKSMYYMILFVHFKISNIFLPNPSRWTQCNHNYHYKRTQEESGSEEKAMWEWKLRLEWCS